MVAFFKRNGILVLLLAIALGLFFAIGGMTPQIYESLIKLLIGFGYGLIFASVLYFLIALISWYREPDDVKLFQPRGELNAEDIPAFKVRLSLNLISLSLYIIEFIAGRVFYKLSKWPIALDRLNKAVKEGSKTQPQLGAVYFFRGNSQYVLSDYKSAIRSYNKALAIDSSYAALFYCRGLALSQIGEYRSAFVDFERAIAISPDLHKVITRRLEVEKPEALKAYYEGEARHKSAKTFKDRQTLMFMRI